jgi:hypothetical protein
MRPTKIEAMTMVAIQELRKIFRKMLTSFLRFRRTCAYPHLTKAEIGSLSSASCLSTFTRSLLRSSTLGRRDG